MDGRVRLNPGTVLPFPGMECTIETFVGRGSNAMVYLGSYPDAQLADLRHRVLIKELFPYHARGGIYRDANLRICRTDEAEDVWRLHYLSFNRGNEVHIRLLGQNPGDIDANINTFPLHGTLYSVLGFSGGRSLDKELLENGGETLGLSVHVRRILGVLDVLEGFHSLGFLHLDISPDNILLIGEGRKERITLIDYNSVHTLDEIRAGRSVYYSAKEGYTAPEIRSGRAEKIGFSSDLYALTAVFYRCISGKALTPMQVIRNTVPDISQAECLADVPETVRSMVRSILKKGLSSLAGRRYQNAGQMRMDLEELQDRIDGKGITHWALWEMGRGAVQSAVKKNPALAYIRDEEKLYPVAAETADGERRTLEEVLERTLGPEGSSALLLGSGGAGKTTALLRAAYMQKAEYSGTEPAMVYLSLYGWEEQDASYIKDRILENLRFKPETDRMETARHELVRLLSSAMHTRLGERPKLLLLLDGLNEAAGDTRLLMKEMEELSRLSGVRILAAGRSDEPSLSFSRISLCPLEEGEIRSVLARHGVLFPEDQSLGKLLQSPMMLSIYIRTVLDRGRQMAGNAPGNQKQLLDDYFTSIREKEMRGLPENSPRMWQISAALEYLLPELAALSHSRRAALDDRDMLPAADRCWRTLGSRMIFKAFPQWIGHISDIRGSAADAESWYGQMVHGLLWRRLGMLVRDESGKYRIFHQVFEEYLVERQKSYGGILQKQRALRKGAAAACILCLAGAAAGLGAAGWRAAAGREASRQTYDEAAAERVMDAAFQAYTYGATQYENMSGLIAGLQGDLSGEGIEETDRKALVEECRAGLSNGLSQEPAPALAYRDTLLASGEVMPWSFKPLDAEAYEALVRLPADRAQEYLEYTDILERALEEPGLWEDLGASYLEELDAVITADAWVLGSYYQDVLAPELEGMENSGSEETREMGSRYRAAIAELDSQYQISREALGTAEEYQAAQAEAGDTFRQNTLRGYFRLSEETEESAGADTETEEARPAADEKAAADHLLLAWSDLLRVIDAAYASELWALDYTDAFLESGSWNDLVRARAACIASARYLTELSMKEKEPQEEEYLALAEAGIDTSYQSAEFKAVPDRMGDAHRSVRDNFLVTLEQSVFDRDTIRILKEETAARREYISSLLGYYQGATNYLLLTLGEWADGPAFWAAMEDSYPILALGRPDWAEDEKLAVERVESCLDSMDAALETLMDLIADRRAQLYSLENILEMEGTGGLEQAVFSITEAPPMLPQPEWYNPQTAGYISFAQDETGNLQYPESGSPLPDGIYGTYIQVPDAGAGEIEAYVHQAEEYADMAWKAEDGEIWYIVMPEYQVKLEAGEEGTTLLFTVQDAAFAPVWYLENDCKF